MGGDTKYLNFSLPVYVFLAINPQCYQEKSQISNRTALNQLNALYCL